MTRSLTARSAALLAALLLGAAACSDADDSEASSVETFSVATETATETATEATEIATEAATEMEPDPATETEITDTGTEGATGDATTGSTGGAAAGDVTGDDIVSALDGAGLTAVAAALQASGMGDQIAALPAFTVFAPSDEAFASLGTDIINMDTADLQGTLGYHVSTERLLIAELGDQSQVDTLAGVPLTVTSDNGTVTVGDSGATVTEADIEVGDTGVIHVIDQVLEPTG